MLCSILSVFTVHLNLVSVGPDDLKKLSSTLTALYNEKVKLQKVCFIMLRSDLRVASC